jgi:hypothetical protein
MYLYKKKRSEVKIEKCYKVQNLLSFFHCKEGNKLACYVKTNCFHFAEMYNHNNKSNMDVKTSSLGNGSEYEKGSFIFCYELSPQQPP